MEIATVGIIGSAHHSASPVQTLPAKQRVVRRPCLSAKPMQTGDGCKLKPALAARYKGGEGTGLRELSTLSALNAALLSTSSSPSKPHLPLPFYPTNETSNI